MSRYSVPTGPEGEYEPGSRSRVLKNLMDMERDILEQRFCFNDSKKRTLRSIARDYGISPETVRQIEKRALRKLREEHSEMQEFLYN